MIKHYVVFVLGDVGRSPRMQYHALSLSKLPNSRVTLAGLCGERCHSTIASQKNIHIYNIADEAWSWTNRLMRVHFITYVIFAVVKLFLQFFFLSYHMFRIVIWERAEYLLVQNPPALPTLTIAWMITRLPFCKCKLVVDWHNYGYTLMTLGNDANKGKLKRVIRWLAQMVYKIVEIGFGRLGDAHLCVSEAFKKDLEKRFNIQ